MSRQLRSFFFACLLFSSGMLSAEMASLSMAVKVKSFDAINVSCEINGRVFNVKRTSILQKTIHTDDVVMVTFYGKDEIAALFEARTPAGK
jgi:hypothetical protein